MLSREAINTNVIVFTLTRLVLELTDLTMLTIKPLMRSETILSTD
jgi:hypothetical protein